MSKTDEDEGFTDNILEYICGFVVKKIKEKMSCKECIDSLFGSHRPGLISIRQMDEKPRLICNIKIFNGFVSLYGNIFKSMDNHSYELMKIIVSCFLSIRFKSHARLINERIKKQNLRSKLMKIVLQNHQ